MNLSAMTNGLKRTLLALSVVAATALTACGGGEQAEKFYPSRLLVFGDEASYVGPVPAGASFTGTGTPNAVKYTINSLNATTAVVDCSAGSAVWVQYLAGNYGFVFDTCNPTGVAATGAKMYATPHAKVADVVAQMAAIHDFNSLDLATVMAGQNDVIELYLAYLATPTDAQLSTALAELRRRGLALAEAANAASRQGARVLVTPIWDVSLSPYGIAQGARASVLSSMTLQFNNALKDGLINDGRYIGLFFADAEVRNMVAYPATYSLVDVVNPACPGVAAPATLDTEAKVWADSDQLINCNTGNLTSSTATAINVLWAGNLQPSPYAHSRFGTVAITRATNNPF